MILAIEIGNTNIVLGCLDNNEIYFVERISTNLYSTDFEYAVKIKSLFDIYNINYENIEGTVISSVVPAMVDKIKNAVTKFIKKPVRIVGPGLKTGINIRMDNPSSVGTDLIINAVGAINKYKAPLLIVFMGTATTISVVDNSGNYIGGIIMPGMEVGLDSLVHSTAQLPHIGLNNSKHVIGKNTIECMQSGIVLGAAASIDGLIDRIEEELGYKTTHIITGCYACKVIDYMKQDMIYEENLFLEGLRIIYNKNR